MTARWAVRAAKKEPGSHSATPALVMQLIIQRLTAAGAIRIKETALSGPCAAAFAPLAVIQINSNGKIDQKYDDHSNLISGWDERTTDNNGHNGADDR